MKKFFKRIFCWHLSWAKAGWKPFSCQANYNYYVCKECGKVKNFGWNGMFQRIPVNYDCIYETYIMPKKAEE